MEFKRITAKNFISFKEMEYTFRNGVAIPIQGINLTQDDQESNGSGKTVLQNIIEYCLIAATSRGNIRDFKLVRRGVGAKEAEISLEIECKTREQTLLIERVIRVKGSSLLKIYINGIPKQIATVSDGNNFILEWLDMTREDILNYYIINKYKYESFFIAPNSRKINLIGRFSNSNLVANSDEKVEKDVKILEDELSELSLSKVGEIEGQITLLESQIEEEESRNIEEEKNIELTKIEEEIGEEELNLKRKEEGLEMVKKEISSYKRKIEIVDKEIFNVSEIFNKFPVIDFSEKYERVQSKILLNQNSFKEHKEQRSEISEIISSLDSKLAEINKTLLGTITCPNCSHQWIEGKDLDVNKLKKEIPIINSDLAYLNSEVSSYDSNIKKIDEKISELLSIKRSISIDEEKQRKSIAKLREDIEVVKNKRRDILKEQEKSDSILKRLIREKEDIGYKLEQLEQSKKKVKNISIDMKRIAQYRKMISGKNDELVVLRGLIEEKELEVFNLKQWVFNFKKFNQYLANQSLRVIQGYANKYLRTFKSDFQIKIEGFKIKADGSVKEAVTPIIFHDNEECEFKEFSGGEKARLEFSIILALQEILNSTNKWGGLNMLFADEVVESLDYLGLALIMGSLKETGKTILMTTHVSNSIEDALVIEKVNGVSNLK